MYMYMLIGIINVSKMLHYVQNVNLKTDLIVYQLK